MCVGIGKPIYSEDRVSLEDLVHSQRDITKSQKNKDKVVKIEATNSTQPEEKVDTKQIPIWVEPSGESVPNNYIIPAYTKVLCKLDKKTMSSYQGFQVMGHVIKGDPHLKGALVIGHMKGVSSSKKRIFIDFNSLVNSKGTELSIAAYAIDQSDKQPGVRAKVESNTGGHILKIIGSTATSVMKLATVADTTGFSDELIDTTSDTLLSDIESQPEYSLEEGTYFYLVFEKSLEMKKEG